jgi:F420-non-reducing hydrogenase small subunit
MTARGSRAATRKLRVNIEWLSDCEGCHVAIVDLHERILEVLGAVELLHCPVLTDIKEIPPAEVGLITGAIRTAHDVHLAESMRKNCETLVAFGTCAVYGGIPGAALFHSRDEILRAVYQDNPTTRAAAPPAQDVAQLQALVTPVDQVVKIDGYLPGCPPHAAFIFDVLRSLLDGSAPKRSEEAVCGRCQRKMTKTEVTQIRRNHEGIPDPETCLLSQGYLCLGSATLDRCMAPCPKNGVPCTGCAGPTPQILTEPQRDIRTEVADRMAGLTEIPRDVVISSIEAEAKTHYAYAMASPMVNQKPTFLIRQWVADAEGES